MMLSVCCNQFRLAQRTLLPQRCNITLAAVSMMSSQQVICQSFSSYQSQSDDQVVFNDGENFTDEQQQSPHINVRLEAIKSAGMTQLHNQTQDIISRTKQPLFEDADLVDIYGNKKQSIAQIQEAARIESAVHDALATYASRYNTFNVKGQVIDVLGVEISPDLKQARVYWCLPRVLDLKGLPSSKLEEVVRRMQKILDERGGKIQGIVHSRLRAYYPPKLKWVAAEHVSKDLKRGVSLEKGKKKWI
ncbi:hypothetical protein QTG54_001745 [Skeletonema marinoi]|uniref:Uncharacterized protein n=1 Tax=Skeletonema marinoi TaxID=267567 RepID=A0AAD8YKG2_9STRA|nr:hypothetical protein QTG54_001745 [Skeletonema marinoi]|mmetsp:Transcript_19888/g.39855  ORF Transcript_19888/g.39855 Transcript_19888/m.39855 type:complete len:247 (-) Transcript_19888:2191-2931(-)